eukprot:9385165-Lingulodinium_polyedra.AAC.1
MHSDGRAHLTEQAPPPGTFGVSLIPTRPGRPASSESLSLAWRLRRSSWRRRPTGLRTLPHSGAVASSHI